MLIFPQIFYEIAYFIGLPKETRISILSLNNTKGFFSYYPAKYLCFSIVSYLVPNKCSTALWDSDIGQTKVASVRRVELLRKLLRASSTTHPQFG
jgi:hypothetical protein